MKYAQRIYRQRKANSITHRENTKLHRENQSLTARLKNATDKWTHVQDVNTFLLLALEDLVGEIVVPEKNCTCHPKSSLP